MWKNYALVSKTNVFSSARSDYRRHRIISLTYDGVLETGYRVLNVRKYTVDCHLQHLQLGLMK